MAKWFPVRRLSWLRLTTLVAICAALVGGSMFAWGSWQDTRAASAMKPWVGGYVDVTAVPSYPFEQPGPGEGRNLVLSFIVGDPDEACAPSWGGAYTLSEAGSALDLDRRIARYRLLGGRLMVSFGGQANQDLSVACTDPSALQSAYTSVIDRYRLSSIDLDIEGDLLRNTAALTRQAEAIAALQGARPENRPLDAWLTLPVTTEGLDGAGVQALDLYLKAGVKLAGVNAMTMDYNDGSDASTTSRIRSSLTGVQVQLRAAYTKRGVSLGNATAWAMVA
ncbi:MAG: glycosyl hydrolase family 18, partial [Actinobacteria bacterium]|nr:glycosyl hydrolase family 18 [Actinomycetota bacterium]